MGGAGGDRIARCGVERLFYLRNDYTTLGKLDILFFILVGAAVKPLFRETLMQWLFNCFTAMNVYAVTVIFELLPLRPVSVSALRHDRLALSPVCRQSCCSQTFEPLYRQVAEHWSVYLFVAASLFGNFAWYFIASDDVERTLTEEVVPLLLLVVLTTLVLSRNLSFPAKNLARGGAAGRKPEDAVRPGS